MFSPVNIAIFASGNGTNMQAITDYFLGHPSLGITPALVISDNPSAYVLDRAKKTGIPFAVLTKEQRSNSEILLPLLKRHGIKYIILAGYLRLIPGFLLEAFPCRILNIHPALLPKYGGKGMYGHHVHEAVKSAGEHESGITIHEINGEYDRGTIVFQAKTPIDPALDTPDEIASKVHELEYRYFPEVIASWIEKKEDNRP